MKTIHYRGQLVTFQLPAHWTAEYEEPDGGTFYDPNDDSVTLRLNVMTLRSPHEFGPNESDIGFPEDLPNLKGPFEVVNQQAICIGPPNRHTENGIAIDIHIWGVTRAVPPRTLRLAIFTTTVRADQADSEKTRSTLAMLLNEVRACIISDASPVSKPSWWQRLMGG